MIDISHLPPRFQNSDVKIFTGSSPVLGSDWQVWNKPAGKSMVDILLIGKGGSGGTGVIGANSTAAGGGGGGSGAQTRVQIPAHLIPDTLYLSLAGRSATTTLASYITIAPKLTAGAGAPAANDVLVIANGGGNGGNASGATAGAAGAGGVAAIASTMPLGWGQIQLAIGGQVGIIGGATGTGPTLTLPVTGLLITGGAGGAGLPAAAVAGGNGGAFGTAGSFPAHLGGNGGTIGTTPPANGSNGYRVKPKLGYHYGGTGGGATHGTATGAGLVQAQGGNGFYGCGGGGNGGALTGSTAATDVGQGGEAIAIITCW